MKHESVPGYFTFHSVYNEFIETHNDFTFVEIGTLLGKSACYFVEKMHNAEKNGEVYTVDSYEFEENVRDVLPKGGHEVPTWSRKEVIEYVREVLPDPAQLLVESSEEASKRFDDRSVDFIYLDGDHSYEGVKKDLEIWIPKVKEGGWIGGHDYDMESVRGALKDSILDPQTAGKRSWIVKDVKV